MILSDSLPIQFWPIGEDTYNESIVCDIEQYPFDYEHNCNKDIKLKWSSSTDEGDYSLAVYDGEGVFVTRLFFTKTFITPLYSYQLIFTPSSIGMCGECFKLILELVVLEDEFTEILQNTDFLTPDTPSTLEPWVSLGDHRAVWEFDAMAKLVPVLAPPGEQINPSDVLIQSFPVRPIGMYRLTISVREEAFGQPIYVRVYIDDTVDHQLIKEVAGTIPTTIPGTVYTEDVLITREFTRVFMQIWTQSGGDLDPYFTCQLISLKEQTVSYTELYKTDYIKSSTDTDCLVEINYKTYKYFEGIVPVVGETYFTIFIPGRFFHPRNKVEQKSIDLSNSKVINTASGLKKQKRLEVYDMPYYMHDKLQLILQYAISGSLLINGVEWTVEEDYAFDGDRPRTYPMQEASVYLTRRNYLVHNVI